MNISDYYEVISTNDHVVHVKYHGFWPDHDADDIPAEAMKLWHGAVNRQNRQKFLAIVDFSEMPVLSDSTKKFMRDAIGYAKTHNLVKGVQVVSRAVAKMGAQDTAEKANHEQSRLVVNSLAEAKIEIEKLKKEL